MKTKLALLLVLPLIPLTSHASDRSTLSFTFDNDGLYGVDQDYTNGLFLSYATGRFQPDGLLKALSLSAWHDTSLDKLEFTLGHKIYTPKELKADYPLVNDRPYSGYLHSELNFISLTPEHAHRFNLTIGTTGEHSLADDAQDFVHGITNSKQPNGWQYQIEDSIVGSIGYLSHFRLGRMQSFSNTEWDISNVSEVNAGNFRSDIATGFMLRWGSRLDGNLGAANIDSEAPFRAGMIGNSSSGWFLFTGFEGRYRFNDVTIDGYRPGIFENSEVHEPSRYDVSIDNVQATGVAGIALYDKQFGIALSTTIKTPDFKNSPRKVYRTGSLSLYTFF